MTRVLLSGATGFIGSEILRRLLEEHANFFIYVLIRGSENESPEVKFQKLVEHWKKFFTLPHDFQNRIQIVPFDLCTSAEIPKIERLTYVFHCAASTNLNSALPEARRSNLFATQRMLRIAAQSKGLKRFIHFSTAYVCGSLGGEIVEENGPVRFHNYYEQSKYEAEQCVQKFGLPYVVLRPSIVVGDSRNGYFRGNKILYAVLRMWMTKRIPRAPLSHNSIVDIVPVDYVVGAALELARQEGALNEVFHLCSGKDAPSPREIFGHAISVFGLPKPQFIPTWAARLLLLPLIFSWLSYELQQILEALRWHIPYLGTRGRRFSTQKSDRILKGTRVKKLRLEDYGDRLFVFCKETKWGKKPFPLKQAQVF